MNVMGAEKTVEKEYFRRNEAAEYLSICVRTLDQLKAEGELPFCKLGATVVFMKKDLDALMAKHRIAVKE